MSIYLCIILALSAQKSKWLTWAQVSAVRLHEVHIVVVPLLILQCSAWWDWDDVWMPGNNLCGLKQPVVLRASELRKTMQLHEVDWSARTGVFAHIQ
jgi:hypothetical protein